MSTKLLLPSFERVVDAPNAVSRLRRFVLDMAVRGLLVEQDSTDGDASAILEQATLPRIERSGRIALSNEFPDSSEVPYTVPDNWVWCRLNQVGVIIGGGTPPSSDTDNFTVGGTGIAWLTPADMASQANLEVQHGARDLTKKGFSSSSATLMPKGTVLFTSRAPIGYVGIAKQEITTNQGFKSLVPSSAVTSRFAAIFFGAFAPAIDAAAPGTTFKEVSGKIVSRLVFALPPLGEQVRISAKVDALMALCDQLEMAQKDRELQRDGLRSASLYRLSSTQNDGDLGNDIRFFLDTSPRMITRADHVGEVRQAILDLAVRGKLVRQDPTNEAAADLLAASDHVRTAVSTQDRRASSMRQDLLGSDLRWLVPDSWEWRGLADLVLFIDYRGKTPEKVATGVRLITAKNIRRGFVSLDPEEFISEGEYDQWMTRGFPAAGDVLFTTEAPMGNAAVVRLSEKFALAQRAINFRPYGSIDPDFLVLQLLSAPFQAVLDKTATGLTAKGIKAAKLKRLPIAVPPLAEQRKIVARTDELMALCDLLEETLASGQIERGRLLDSLLHDALAGEAGAMASAVATG
jgi:type I restriction enzyme S subunit